MENTLRALKMKNVTDGGDVPVHAKIVLLNKYTIIIILIFITYKCGKCVS